MIPRSLFRQIAAGFYPSIFAGMSEDESRVLYESIHNGMTCKELTALATPYLRQTA